VIPPPDRIARILLVEDNDDNRSVYSTMLSHFGYDVIEARDGADAIAKARTEHPDLILMDISIPVIDGLAVTAILRSEDATRAVPIIAVTAHALAADRQRALDAGCTAYLAKPCQPVQVVEAVQRVLAQSEQSFAPSAPPPPGAAPGGAGDAQAARPLTKIAREAPGFSRGEDVTTATSNAAAT
jgi:two-component system cell cycle response regulator DivK